MCKRYSHILANFIFTTILCKYPFLLYPFFDRFAIKDLGKMACDYIVCGTNVTPALTVQTQALFLAVLPLCLQISACSHLSY